jgi:hypothetical protein
LGCLLAKEINKMPDIPVSSPLGYIGVFLLILGIFLILAGFDIIKIQQVTVMSGKKTYVAGLIFTLIGISSLLLEASGFLTRIPGTSPITTDPKAQVLLLRSPCGNEYVVRANEPIVIYYGTWATKGLDLAQQWTTALSVDLSIDGAPVFGKQQPPSADLPLNCSKDYENSYWLYYITEIPGFSPGEHTVIQSTNVLRALPDEPGGTNYEPGQIVSVTFQVIAR